MWRQLSKVIVSHSNRPHGTNTRFQCADHSRAEGQNARQMLAAISGKAGNTDIAISAVTLIELAHGPTDSSSHRTSSRPLSVDICFRDSVVFTSSTCWHTMPRFTQSFPLSHPIHGELVFDSECS